MKDAHPQKSGGSTLESRKDADPAAGSPNPNLSPPNNANHSTSLTCAFPATILPILAA